MQLVCFLLTAAVLTGPPTQRDDPTARAEATLRRVAELSSSEQRVWLQRLENRLVWASRLTMKREEAEQEEARLRALLRDPKVPWQTLVDLTRLLEQREKAAIARLVRHYRSQVYETFRKQERTLVERQEAWYRVWSAWEAAGSPPEQQDRLMDWLEAAIRNSMPDAIRALPADPKFDDRERLADLRVPGTKPGAQEAPGKPAPKKPKTEDGKVVAQPLPPSAKPKAEPPRAKQEPESPAPRQRLPEAVAEIRPLMPTSPPLRRLPVPDPQVVSPRLRGPSGKLRISRNAQTAAQPSTEVASVPSPVLAPRESIQEPPVSKPSRSAPGTSMAGLPRSLPLGALPVLPSTAGQLAEAPGVGPVSSSPAVPSTVRRRPPELPRPRPTDASLAGSSPSAPPLAAIQPRQAAASSQGISGGVTLRRPMVPEHDPLAMLPRGVPIEPSLARPASHAETSPATLAKAKPAEEQEQAQEQAQVNVEELAARIAGVKLNLHTLEAELEEDRPWDADHLDALVNRLDILVLRQRDLGLFRDLISAEEQAKVGRIEPPKQAISRLSARIVEVRDRVRGEGFHGSEDERQAALKHLDELSDRIAELASDR